MLKSRPHYLVIGLLTVLFLTSCSSPVNQISGKYYGETTIVETHYELIFDDLGNVVDVIETIDSSFFTGDFVEILAAEESNNFVLSVSDNLIHLEDNLTEDFMVNESNEYSTNVNYGYFTKNLIFKLSELDSIKIDYDSYYDFENPIKTIISFVGLKN